MDQLLSCGGECSVERRAVGSLERREKEVNSGHGLRRPRSSSFSVGLTRVEKQGSEEDEVTRTCW